MCAHDPEVGHVQEENEDEEELLDGLAACLTAILRNYGDAVLPMMDLLMPKLGALLDPSRSSEERRVGICIVDDILEHSPACTSFPTLALTFGASVCTFSQPWLAPSRATNGNEILCVLALGCVYLQLNMLSTVGDEMILASSRSYTLLGPLGIHCSQVSASASPSQVLWCFETLVVMVDHQIDKTAIIGMAPGWRWRVYWATADAFSPSPGWEHGAPRGFCWC